MAGSARSMVARSCPIVEAPEVVAGLLSSPMKTATVCSRRRREEEGVVPVRLANRDHW